MLTLLHTSLIGFQLLRTAKARLLKEHIAVLMTVVLSVVSGVMAVLAMLALESGFFQDYSELKDYVVFSNEDASYSFEKIADSITLKEMQSVAKGDGNSKTISARDSQQSSYVAKLLCIKAIPYGY